MRSACPATRRCSVACSSSLCGSLPAPQPSAPASTSTSTGPCRCATPTGPGSPKRRARSSGSYLRLGVELDRRRVDAVAKAGRVRAVVEDVTKVAAAVGAGDLGPDHEKASVLVFLDGGTLRRRVEARPAAVGVEFGLGLKELRAAAGAQVSTRCRGVPVLAGERPLGA